jgi:Replication-relaxation
LGTYKEVKVEAAWSPQMYHRLRTVDLLIALELSVRKRPHLAIVKTFLEYKRLRRGNQIISETMDYVDSNASGENKIIPDAAFILENIESRRRALFFLEMDMATERIITGSLAGNQTTLSRKFSQYDRYLKSMRFGKTYAGYGEFRSFTMLFVTTLETRIENIRRELSGFPNDSSRHYRLTTFDEAMENFLGAVWHSLLLTDRTRYPLVREEPHISGVGERG